MRISDIGSVSVADREKVAGIIAVLTFEQSRKSGADDQSKEEDQKARPNAGREEVPRLVDLVLKAKQPEA